MDFRINSSYQILSIMSIYFVFECTRSVSEGIFVLFVRFDRCTKASPQRGRITGTLVREESYYANLCARGRPNGLSRRRAVARGLKWKITDAVTVQVSVTNGLIIIICFKHSLTFLLAKLRWRIAERDDHGSACRLRPLESAMYRTGGWSRRR